MSADPTRPDPDKLLNLVNQDRSVSGRGRLKVFFGASAGVGKTFAMLSEAQRLAAEGRDVVIGVIEHHGRSDTAALIDGLQRLPMADIEHRGIKLKEFDLDGALKRKPGLILIDEFAHSNAPGSRHPKRWQDVEELIDNGIDVFTTINVQHLESVNDMVAQLTGIWVQETVPDQIFDKADEIALIDIPSDDLLKRLAEGKVYVAEGANTRAAENFFKKTNLNALREMALRRMAERVDAESDELNAAMGVKETPIGQKILVLVGHDALTTRLIRHGRRMAVRAKAPWVALYLQTARHERLGNRARMRVETNLQLAEKLGAEVVRIAVSDPLPHILSYARTNGFSRIVVGHRHRPAWLRVLRPSLANQLIEAGAGIEITTITEDGSTRNLFTHRDRPDFSPYVARPLHYLYAAAGVAISTLIGLPLRAMTPADNLTMIYLVGVVFVAVWFGIGPSMFASLASVLAFNFFFTLPYYTLAFDDTHYYITFAVMLITSLAVGSLAARVSLHARQSRQSEHETRILYGLTRGLSSVRGFEAMANVAVTHLADSYQLRLRFWVPNGSGFDSYPEQEAGNALAEADLKELSAVHWVAHNAQTAGRQTDTMPSARGLYLPLVAENETLGVMGLTPLDDKRQFTGADFLQFETFASLMAGALQRSVRADEAARTRVESESEKLRNVLLSSLSHDLRTPLTVMNGGLSTLLRMRKKLPREAVDEIASLWSQLDRLQKFVANLLNMAAITSGRMSLNFQPYLIQEIIGAAIQRVQSQKQDRQITTTIVGQLPMVMIDGALIEQVLINLIENAIAHTADDGTIMLTVERDADRVRVRISDDGEGLPPGEEDRIFDKFHTARRAGPAASDQLSPDRLPPDRLTSDRQGHGTGLGLAICRGIIQAHDGIIYARNNSDDPSGKGGTGSGKGASFIFTLPTADLAAKSP